MFLDQPLEQTDREGDAGRLEGLQVDRSEQVAHQFLQGADALAGRMAGKRRRIGRVAEIGHRGDGRREIKDPVAPDCDDRRPRRISRAPDATDQGSGRAVLGQDFAE